MSLGQVTTSAFITCNPVAIANVYTTVYTTTAIAANPTTSWLATYTITEVCTGSPSEYKTRDTPPGFAETTVYCKPCAQKTITIICPIPTPTANVAINGNGVTAAANPVVTAGAYGTYGGYGSSPGAVAPGQNNSPNSAPTGTPNQAPGYGVYGSYGSYDQVAPAQPAQPGQPGASGAAGAPGATPGTNFTRPSTVVAASALSLKRGLSLVCGIAMVAGLVVFA
ncbi:hypothetical protein LZ32DRAFT_144406 [Colletotrichum eremochloae]|nr:hypothetical protein LZ32DRAFT_144406 [Colletotrichum eremochloae]